MDVKTGLVILLLTTCVMGIAFGALHRTTKPLAGPKEWAIGSFCAAIGLLLLLGRGNIPDFVSIIVANTFTSFAYVAFFSGVRSFVGKPANQAFLLSILVLSISLMALFTYSWPDLNIRVIVMALTHGGLTGMMAWTLYSTEIEGGRFARLFTTIFLAITSLAIFSQLYLVYAGANSMQDVMAHPFVGFRVAFATASSFAWTFGLILLSTQHFVQQNQNQQYELENEITMRKAAEQARRRSQKRQSDFADVGSDWLWEMDKELRFTYFSNALLRYNGGTDFTEYLGKRRDELPVADGVSEEDWAKHLDLLKRRKPFRDFQYVFVDKNGDKHWWSISGKPSFDEDGSFIGYRGVGRDITKPKAIEEERQRLLKDIEDSEAQLRGIFNGTIDGIVVIDGNGQISSANQASEAMFGYSSDQLVEKNILTLVAKNESESALEKLSYLMEKGALDATGGEHWEVEFRRKNNSTFPAVVAFNTFKHHGKSMFVLVARDVSNQKQAEDRIRHMATHDALTGLPNLTLGRDRLSVALAIARRSKTKAGLLFVDLDGFKTVNDTWGHDVGDAALITVAERLIKAVREVDTVARIGGDEFIVILEELHKREDAEIVAKKIIEEVSAPYDLGDDRHATIGTSIGIAIYPEHGESEEDLLKLADNAMYHVKRSGKNNYRFG